MREDIVLHKAIVTRQKEIAPGVFVLSFKRWFNFEAGQVVAITTAKPVSPRIYSICSGVKDQDVDILYDVKAEGQLTPRLKQLKSGDSIQVSEPYGNFTTDHSKAYFIATGTGIAPFVSMIKSGFIENKTLIHGARQEPYFYYADFLVDRLKTHYIRCCSQCQSTENYAGRLTHFLAGQNNLPLDQKYYLCGMAEMVVEVRDMLIAKKIPYQHIISEIYF